MKRRLHKELDKLKRKIFSLGEDVEKNVLASIEALENQNTSLAHDVIAKDKEVDLKEVEVEEECLKILALHQPVAVDLRLIISTLKLIILLKESLTLLLILQKRLCFFVNQNLFDVQFDYSPMTKKVQEMLKGSRESFMNMDVALAKKICQLDDEVDELHTKNYNQIPKDVSQYSYYSRFITVSKNLERICDYATNICEDVIYMVDGEIIRHGDGD